MQVDERGQMATFSKARFKVLVRFMIQAAQDKRCVTYAEIENVFGLSHKQAGVYAGRLGDYCIFKKIPPLNALLISSYKCIPSEGFDWYQEQHGKSWGELVSECWRYFHLTSSRRKQVQNFSRRDNDVDDFLRSRTTR